VQYESSTQEGWSSFEDYVGRMREGQKAIYYAAGPSRQLIEGSPHLEELRKRGYEVLYRTDPIASFAMSALDEFEGKPLVNAMTESLSLEDEPGSGEDESKDDESAEREHVAFLEHVKSVLGDKVGEVRASRRLTDSPACLVIAEGGMAPHIEQMLRARKMDVPASKRIFEVNTSHPVVLNVEKAFAASSDSERVQSWIRTLYDQALIAEGSPLEDPADFARRLTALVQQASSAAP
jgi:molecular chaperone HtpG